MQCIFRGTTNGMFRMSKESYAFKRLHFDARKFHWNWRWLSVDERCHYLKMKAAVLPSSCCWFRIFVNCSLKAFYLSVSLFAMIWSAYEKNEVSGKTSIIGSERMRRWLRWTDWLHTNFNSQWLYPPINQTSIGGDSAECSPQTLEKMFE